MTVVHRDVGQRVERRVARAEHRCENYPYHCPPIKPGDVYLLHTAYPGQDWNDGWTKPGSLAECGPCATTSGREHLLADPDPEASRVKECVLCGRTGRKGFTHYPETEVLGGVVEAFDQCIGKVACRRRQWRGMPQEARNLILNWRYE
jgi:hypothetical protein